jgi:hypothetical protein
VLPLAPSFPGTSCAPASSPFDDINPSSLQHDCQAYLGVVHSTNNNLRSSQRELLLWHQRLSHYNLDTVRRLTQ